jgi:uncharacterized protein (DUF885 family)
MGMYETRYDRFGMLTFQMWRAARLVIDTGIHHKGLARRPFVTCRTTPRSPTTTLRSK